MHIVSSEQSSCNTDKDRPKSYRRAMWLQVLSTQILILCLPSFFCIIFGSSLRPHVLLRMQVLQDGDLFPFYNSRCQRSRRVSRYSVTVIVCISCTNLHSYISKNQYQVSHFTATCWSYNKDFTTYRKLYFSCYCNSWENLFTCNPSVCNLQMQCVS